MVKLYFYIYLYWGKCPLGHIRPLPCKIITYFFFHFRCILLQISHKKSFFISISILGRSGVKNVLTVDIIYNAVLGFYK